MEDENYSENEVNESEDSGEDEVNEEEDGEGSDEGDENDDEIEESGGVDGMADMMSKILHQQVGRKVGSYSKIADLIN